jgi:hypothetical protein
VANRVWSLSPAITSPPKCFVDYVNPGFPLVSEDILIVNNAIYGGMTYDFIAGDVALVSSGGISCMSLSSEAESHLTNCASNSGILSSKAPSRSQFYSARTMSFKGMTSWVHRHEHVLSPDSSISLSVRSVAKSLISPARIR